jgi:hypothetical protein
MPIALVAVGVAAAAAAAGSAVAKGQAKRKAANMQIDALKNMKKLDPKVYEKLVADKDTEAWKRRLKTMRDVDPELATIRDQSIKAFTTQLAKNANETGRSDEIANYVMGLAEQFNAGAPAEMDVGDAMIARAREKLDRGAELPPTYQAEMIRSGLEQAGGAGIGPDRKGAVTGVLGKLLGREAMAVERQNEADAMQLAQAGGQISANRMNILQGLIPQMQNYEAAKTNLAAQGMAMVNTETPSKIGLGGQDMMNLWERRRLEGNKEAQAVAKLEGEKAMAKAEMLSGLFQSASQGVGAIAGGLGGGAGGMMGGMAGGAAGGGGFANVGQNIPLLGMRQSQNLGYGGYIGAGAQGPTVMRSPQGWANYDLASQAWQ